MEFKKNIIEDYVNSFAADCASMNNRISVTFDDNKLLLDNNCKDTIYIGKYAYSLQLLYSGFANNKNLFKRILFFYYWGLKNFHMRRLGNSAFCFQKFLSVLTKKQHKIYGYAQQFYNNLLFNYMIGHECAHICFAWNSEYKKKCIDEVIGIFDSYDEVINENKNNIYSKIYTDIQQNNSIDVHAEEFACDRESIKYLIRYISKNSEIQHDELIALLMQILNLTMMFQYDVNMNSLIEFDVFNKNSYNKYLRKHIGIGVLRLANVTLLLQDLIPEEDIAKYFTDANKQLQKQLSGIGIFRITDIGMAINDEEIELDENVVSGFREDIDKFSNILCSLLQGEDIST